MPIVFGLWGAAADDLWAVGGILGGAGDGFAWHFDGAAWSATTGGGVPMEIASAGTVFKVYGRASDDVWMSCTAGKMLHWDGVAFDEQDLNVPEVSLLSVSGDAERFVTVGGAFEGVIYENEGDGWNSALDSGSSDLLTGVVVRDGQAYAVGQFGTVLRRESDGWKVDEGDQLSQENLHAAWIDPAGGVWVVGGQFDGHPTTAGVLLHRGTPLEGSLP